MDYSQYQPPIIDGILNYGEMHAKRRLDASHDYFMTHTLESRKILTVLCTQRHPIAWVEDSSPHVIFCWQSGKADISLKNLRQESDLNGLEYSPREYCDFIDAGDDLDLEVQCKCGGMKTLDRNKIREALASKSKRLIVP
jgi:hypothetical protein